MTDLIENLRFDSEKAIETIVYLAERAPIADIYHIGKIVYFADRIHLDNYGRELFGDQYNALKDGPVPSKTYDLIKDVRDTRHSANYDHASSSFSVSGFNVRALREPDLDLFSDSDLECLDEAIRMVGDLPFGRLKRMSHDNPYNSVSLNALIPLESIVADLSNGELLSEHLRDPHL